MSYMGSPVSPRTAKNQNGSEWIISVLQKKAACFLFLLLMLWTLLILSVWYFSHSYTFAGKEALTKQSAVVTDHNKVNSTLQLPVDELPFESCDVSKGKWIRDTTEPIYSNLTCSSLPESRNCVKYGKPPGYLYWRWKPDECDMPRFDPRKFLDLVRGKNLALVGDSLARNQYESLRCLLSQAETPVHVYHDRNYQFWTYHYPSSNFTLKVLWSEFYVQGIPFNSSSYTAPYDIHLDKINTNWTSQLPGLDYLIISGGNWFVDRVLYLYENNSRIGCINCQDDNVKHYDKAYVIGRVVRKALESINACQNCDGLKTFIRTYVTSHFENGSWSTGGHCKRTQPLDETEMNLDGIEWEIRKVQIEEIKRIKKLNDNHKKYFGIMDVTKAMMIRADGHPGLNYLNKVFKSLTDCLHWCLPGPIDMWSEMLMFNLMKYSS